MPVSHNFEQEKLWVCGSSVGELQRPDRWLGIQGFLAADQAVRKLTHDVRVCWGCSQISKGHRGISELKQGIFHLQHILMLYNAPTRMELLVLLD